MRVFALAITPSVRAKQHEYLAAAHLDQSKICHRQAGPRSLKHCRHIHILCAIYMYVCTS